MLLSYTLENCLIILGKTLKLNLNTFALKVEPSYVVTGLIPEHLHFGHRFKVFVFVF